eukprot:gene18832-24613_t
MDIAETESSSYDTFNGNVSVEVSNKRWINKSILFSVFISIVCVLYFVSFNKQHKISVYSSTDSLSYTINIESLSPGYESADLASLEILPWDIIAEPARDQVLKVTSFLIEDNTVDLSDYIVTWSLNNQMYKGESIDFLIDEVGVYDAVVSISPIKKSKSHALRSINPDSLISKKRKLKGDFDINTVDLTSTSQSFQLHFTLAVKYIRREIRTLTDDDREKYFNALLLTYKLNDDEGQKLYGSKYHSAAYFAAKHLLGAGRTDCDHWHDGAGFMNNHIAIILELEQSLQSIDPSISAPYWEYGDDTIASEIFDPDWYGEFSPTSPPYAISDGGIWDGVSVPDGSPYKQWDLSSGSLNPFVNAYGMLRAPWNNNPSNFISRHNKTYGGSDSTKFPGCENFEDCFNSETLADLNFCLNGNTHGPIHVYIGGAWGEGDSINGITVLNSIFKLLSFKYLWRMGYTRCPSSCSLGDECKCSVPDEYIDTYGAKGILQKTGLDWLITNFTAVYGDSDKHYYNMLRGIEDPGVAGEMFSSAASYDPLFWGVHGATERLYGYKRILVDQGDEETFDSTWGFGADTYTQVVLHGICDWSNVKDVSDLTLPSCSFDEECPGHDEDETIDFSNFLNTGETYTNNEFFDFTHPWNDDLPYVYDSYFFDYCPSKYSFTSKPRAYKGHQL